MEEVKIVLPLEDFIRDNGMEKFIEVTVKNRGIWVIHLSDADPWPSKPHAHNLESNEKLNLLTGEVFNATTHKFLYKMSDKTMNFFYKKLTKDPNKELAKQLIAQKANITYKIS